MLFCACMVVPIFTGHLPDVGVGCYRSAKHRGGAHQGWSANLFTTTSDMFPYSAVGSVTGIGGMAGAAGGALIAFYAGHILQRTHSYASLFAIAGSAYLVGPGHYVSARSRTEESGVCFVSLLCAKGSPETDLSLGEMNESAG